MHPQLMTNIRRSCCLLFLFLAGCARLPMTGALPDRAAVTEVARVGAGTPFALDPSGERIAFVSDGLLIKELGSGNERQAASEEPTAVAWDHDGKELAASFAREDGTVLRRYDRQGKVRAETRTDGRVSALAWLPSGDLLAFAVKQRAYSFGVSISELLYRWDGTGEPAATILYGTTLKWGTLRQWDEVLRRTLTFALSPLLEEVLYGQVHDPPVFTPYQKIVLRNLESGQEREVATVTPRSAGGVFSGTGERILFGDGETESWLLDPKGNRLIATMPSPGRSIALSPSGCYLLLDGRLYRDGTRIASFPATIAGAFSARDGRLAIRYGERLYLVTGLPDEAALLPDQATAKRLDNNNAGGER